MIPELIQKLLDEAPVVFEDHPLAARIDAEAEREGLMLRNAPRRFASGGRKHRETKYDKLHYDYQDGKRALRKVLNAATDDLVQPIPILPEPIPVQEPIAGPAETPKPVVKRVKKRSECRNLKQFDRMRARRIGVHDAD